MKTKDTFKSWHSASQFKEHPAWNQNIDWHNEQMLDLLLDLFDIEARPLWQSDIEPLSELSSLIISDLVEASNDEKIKNNDFNKYFRLHVSTANMTLCNQIGRFGFTYDWAICSLTDNPFVVSEEVGAYEYYPDYSRLFLCISSKSEIVKVNAFRSLMEWFSAIFYYGRKHGGHKELISEIFPFAKKFLLENSRAPGGACIEAICQLASWVEINKPEETSDLATELTTLFEDDQLPRQARKLTAITLASLLGHKAGLDTSDIAEKALLDLPDVLIRQERVQLLITCCLNRSLFPKYIESAVENIFLFANETKKLFRDKKTNFIYHQNRLYDIISPLVRLLGENGDCNLAINLISKWYLVEEKKTKKSNVMLILPNYTLGPMYITKGGKAIFKRPEHSTLTSLTQVTNEFLQTNIIIVDDPDSKPHIADGFPAQNKQLSDQFEQATVDYLQLDNLPHFIAENKVSPDDTSIVMGTSMPQPVQALMKRHSGDCFPLCTSLEEAEPDRPLKKVLLFHSSTLTGEFELNSLETYLNELGINTEKYTNANMTTEEFLALYEDPSFDAILISSHGEFTPNDPHLSRFYISDDISKYVTLSDLMKIKIKSEGRRLLTLNFCFGGATQINTAPPRYGIAAMLTSSKQAVISHLWPVSSAIAPVFSSLLAIGLNSYGSYFKAFSFALGGLNSNTDEMLDALRHDAGCFSEIISRIERSSEDFSKITTWGSPIFYE